MGAKDYARGYLAGRRRDRRDMEQLREELEELKQAHRDTVVRMVRLALETEERRPAIGLDALPPIRAASFLAEHDADIKSLGVDKVAAAIRTIRASSLPDTPTT